MDHLQVKRWLRDLDTEDEVVESEEGEVHAEPDLQVLPREAEVLRRNEEEVLSKSNDSEDVPLLELVTRRSGTVYKSTDGTIWRKNVPPATQNIRIKPPGPKRDAARNAKDPLSCFELIFTQEIAGHPLKHFLDNLCKFRI